MTRVLVVEDERALLRALAMNLTARGYEVTEAETGTRALSAAAAVEHDVILLDLGLPDLERAGRDPGVRAYAQTPIIVLSARTGSGDKVGRARPGRRRLRHQAVQHRRAAGPAAGGNPPHPEPGRGRAVVLVGSARVDLEAKTVTAADGSRIHLTPTEWHLLEALVRHPGKLVTGRALLDRAARHPRPHRPELPAHLHRPAPAQARARAEPAPAPDHRAGHGLPLPALSPPIGQRSLA